MLINGSLDRLLELAREAKAHTIVMGPSIRAIIPRNMFDVLNSRILLPVKNQLS